MTRRFEVTIDFCSSIFIFFAWAYINLLRLYALLFVCWHVCKNREGLEMILLQSWCLRYTCLRLTFNENTWQYLFLALFYVESVQCDHQLRMDVYTRPELTDMIMCYWAAGGNGRRALRMWNHPHHTMFTHLYQLLREEGSLRPQCIGGRPRQMRTPAFEKEVLERVGNDPSTSTRAIAHVMGSNQFSVLWVLPRTKPPHIPLPESTRTGSQWLHTSCSICPWSMVNAAFPAQVLFTDVACFTRDGYFNSRNSHIWDDENPHAVFMRVHQARFNLNIWGGILGDYLLGRVIIPDRFNGKLTCNSSRTCFRCSWKRYPLQYGEKCGSNMIALQPASTSTSEVLNRVYSRKWIGRGGPVAWPARSPNLTPLDFFLWGHVKSIMYIYPVNTRQELIERMFTAFYQIWHSPGMFTRVRQALARRCNECNQV